MAARFILIVCVIGCLWIQALRADPPLSCGIGVVAANDAPETSSPEAPNGTIRDHIVVHNIVPNSESEKAGMGTGDEIVEIDGHNVAGMRFVDAINLIRGPEGTSIRLTVKRQGLSVPLSLSILREPLVMPVSFH